MDKWISAVVSSTVRDLKPHREKIKDACLRRHIYPKMMEHLPASDAGAIAASLQLVDDVDLYIGIFGFCYGYVPEGHERSLTHLEYERAVERGIPRLIYLMHADHPDALADPPESANAGKLKTLRAELEKEQVVEYFRSPDELWGMVIHGLVELNPSSKARKRERPLVELPRMENLDFAPLGDAIHDPSVYALYIDGPKSMTVERRGKLESREIAFEDADHLQSWVRQLFGKIGVQIDADRPIAECLFPGDFMITAILPPYAIGGPNVAIQRPNDTTLLLEDLLNYKAFTPEMAMYLEAAIKSRLNVLVSAGTGAGGATLINVLSSFIPADERVVTLESAPDFHMPRLNPVRLFAAAVGEPSRNTLLKFARSLRPERFLVGSVAGPEVRPVLELMNAGHAGSMLLIHANSAEKAIKKLEQHLVITDERIPVSVAREWISDSIDVVIQINRLQGGPRKVTTIVDVTGKLTKDGQIEMLPIFQFQQLGIDQNYRAYGQFECTGNKPAALARFEAVGIRMPSNMFTKRTLLKD